MTAKTDARFVVACIYPLFGSEGVGMQLGFDIQGGCRLALDEMFGDWYRDPWGWPEFHWLAQHQDQFDIKTVLTKRHSEYRLSNPASFHLLEVPKSRLGLRPAVIQDSMSRLIYASAVSSNLAQLHKDLPEWVYGWRYRPDVGRTRNSEEWRHYLTHFDDGPVGSDWALQVDIASCFASMDVVRLIERLHELLGKSAAVSVIGDILNTHHGLTTRSGLPQRSFASAALAHVYLRPLDDALIAASKSGATAVTRWMDDITAFGSEERMYRLFLDLRDRLHQMGLVFNDAKSRLISADEAASLVRDEDLREINIPTRASTGSGGGASVEHDTDGLIDLESRILEAPGAFSRPVLKAVLSSLKRYREWGQWRRWLEIAHRIPHVADSLGRYLRTAATLDESTMPSSPLKGSWDHLTEWFVNYASQGWARVGWTNSQLALMFPATVQQSEIVDVWAEWLEKSEQAQMVAIAGQRLASRDPSLCRDIIRGRVDHVTDPILLRILALAMHSARGDRSIVRSVLDRDPRNGLVSLALEGSNWAQPKVVLDFDSAAVQDHE